MAVSVHRLQHLVSAAAADGDLLAVSTPEHRVVLYRRGGSGGLQRLAELEGHDATISALHFAGGGDAEPRRLVSSSHDRNSYVWTQAAPASAQQQGGAAAGKENGKDNTVTDAAAAAAKRQGGQAQAAAAQQAHQQQPCGGWQPELVITKLRRAGLAAAWAPCARKFALGGSERAAAVCYLDAGRQLWAPRLVKKKHACSVMAVAWHPSGALLATASTDGRLRLFNGRVPEVDGRGEPPPALAGTRFGDCLLEAELPGGWGLALAFSPGGDTLAAASQASQLTLLCGIDLSDPASLDAAAAGAGGRLQHLRLPGLPLKCLAFLSDGLLAGGGFGCQPLLCARGPGGTWRCARSLQGEAASSSASASGGGPKSAALSARIKMFEAQAAAASAATSGSRAAAAAVAAGAAGTGGSAGSGQQAAAQQHQQGGPHRNTIIAVAPLPAPASAPGGSLAFLTASLEGVVAEWVVDPASL